MTRSVSILMFPIFIGSVILIGCGDKEDEAEAADARVLLPVVQQELDRTKKNMDSLSEQLQEARLLQDQLEEQIRLLTTARDDAVNIAETSNKNISDLTVQLDEQSERISYLENEIEKLNAVVEDQRTIIAGQEATIAELVSLIEQVVPQEQQEDFR